ncbi:MAG: methylated-DNA--[protein]-cysteine S-methyltransferase [Gammaproteobacteria bacterium]|nr:methylated-DNA--[protein]-cysteine S-methyltransferase [Gammaproteobacteria bacterium]
MTDQQNLNYQRIGAAIGYIKDHFQEQPTLSEIASAIGLSQFHFQRLFIAWAGVSPKKFIQYLSIEYAKKRLHNQHSNLLDVAYETGLSGPSRLHDLFIGIEGMTPGEFKNGGEKLSINYGFAPSPFGQIMVASTAKGICHLSFVEAEAQPLSRLKWQLPNASYHQSADKFQRDALAIFNHNWEQLPQLKLHLQGTAFQLKVWQALLSIPMGNLSSYGDIAQKIGHPKASRAVGTAIGSNPVALLIPCHRVIRSCGKLGGYHWGETRKSAMLGWEASKIAAST